MEGRDKILSISNRYSVNDWWAEAVIIEYLKCRRFAYVDELWYFDFNLVSNDDAKLITTLNLVISNNMILYHKIKPDKLKEAFQQVMSGQAYTPHSLIVRGLDKRYIEIEIPRKSLYKIVSPIKELNFLNTSGCRTY